jgi:citrate lyase beta subunit
MLRQVETAADVADAAEIITRLERERRLADGAVGLIVSIGSASGVWHVRTILAASPRISQVVLDERALAADLGITPEPDYDAFAYARGRVVVEAVAAKVGAVDMAWPLSVEPRELPASEIQTWATKAKNLGMKGVLCPFASWVAPVNAAFTPSAELVAWNKRVREAFAAGVAAGTAAVPLDGRMIDVPVDEWAIVVLEMAQACAARDAEKEAALARSDI